MTRNGTTTRNGKHKGTDGASLPRHQIEVTTKYGMPDAAGKALMGKIPLVGVAGAREVRVSSLYEIRGKLTASQINQISRDLLSDPITQEYRVEKSTPSPAFLRGPHWRLEIWYKPTVADPAGLSTKRAVGDLGLPEPAEVRTGKAYHIMGRINRSQAEKILNKLLANPVIHQTKVIQA